jgi:hypothetical protein
MLVLVTPQLNYLAVPGESRTSFAAIEYQIARGEALRTTMFALRKRGIIAQLCCPSDNFPLFCKASRVIIATPPCASS